MNAEKEAVESLNKAWDVLGNQGLAKALESLLATKGCGEYCGNYGDCGGYCKPMGPAAMRMGEEVINPSPIEAEGLTKSKKVEPPTKAPFSG